MSGAGGAAMHFQHRPILAFVRAFPTKLKPLSAPVPISFNLRFSSSRSSMSEPVSVSRRIRVATNEGDGSMPWRPSALGTSDGDVGGGVVLEQEEEEPLVRRSPAQFLSGLFAGGLEPALNRLSKWLISAVLGALILWRHDAEALWAVIGSIANVILSVTLKRVLNQQRPVSNLRSNSKSDPGMPSSHAQSIFFAVIFLILSTVEVLGMNAPSLILSALIFVIGSYFAWLRVSQQYHTMSQVVVGSVVGFSFAIAWFWLWSAFLLEDFNSMLGVQLLVVLGAAACAIGFLVYVVQTWFTEEE